MNITCPECHGIVRPGDCCGCRETENPPTQEPQTRSKPGWIQTVFVNTVHGVGQRIHYRVDLDVDRLDAMVRKAASLGQTQVRRAHGGALLIEITARVPMEKTHDDTAIQPPSSDIGPGED